MNCYRSKIACVFACTSLLLAATLCGCAVLGHNGISEAQASGAAVQAALAQWRGILPRVIGTKRLQNGNWLVFIDLLPGVPGAHNAAEISARDGEVVAWYGGS